MGQSLFHNARKGPNAGLWVYPLLLCAVPVAMYFLFHLIITTMDPSGRFRAVDESLIVSALTGVSVCFVSTVFSGVLLMSFIVVVRRVVTFFSDIFSGVPVKYAFEFYRDSIRYEGVAFWIILLPIVLNVIYLILVLNCYYKGVPFLHFLH